MHIVHFLTLPSAAVSCDSQHDQDSGNHAGLGMGYLPHLQESSILIHCPKDDDSIRLDISKMVESRTGNSDPEAMWEFIAGREDERRVLCLFL